MFSCRHFSKFLSDPIEKQGATPKRGQEAISSKVSPTAKSKPMVPAGEDKTRQLGVTQLVERNVDEGQGR